MTECFYNKFHPTLPQCKHEGRPLPEGFFKTGNGTDSWTWCEAHSKPFTRDPVAKATPDREAVTNV